jgi:hypothetical protein
LIDLAAVGVGTDLRFEENYLQELPCFHALPQQHPAQKIFDNTMLGDVSYL